MVVITLTNCPPALRGDLTKWLWEINAGVFVGRISKRVRDNLWKRVAEYVKDGRATMVYSASNEQGFDFKTLHSTWEPIDFDGLKLMLRPSPSRIKHLNERRKPGYSKASRYRIAARSVSRQAGVSETVANIYTVIDIETTGLSPVKDDIIEIGAIRVVNGKIADTFSSLIHSETPISQNIQELTGITNEMLAEQGEDLQIIARRFLEFVGDSPIVAHNTKFDAAFLFEACRRCGISEPKSKLVDTLSMARSSAIDVRSYTLKSLSEYFDLVAGGYHRVLADCILTHQLFEKLIKMDPKSSQNG
ncbi:MAG: type I-E CRISPR-associated endoribonuclease Cas2e [Armatimonadota bacterium]